ncbi:hypothetical protein XH93_09285 [Bradyrhizobium sp. CCBAU 51753]|nr:hypothetical protein XH93_09285 [Bradyrhizobium sp. CCBAU 51753]
MFRYRRRLLRQALQDVDPSEAVTGWSYIVGYAYLRQREQVLTNLKVRHRQPVRQAIDQPRAVQPTTVPGKALQFTMGLNDAVGVDH